MSEPEDKLGKLNPMQERFCKEYVKDLNATHAADRAGYSKNSASEQGSRLLGNLKVKVRIQQLMDKRSKKLEITAEKVLRDIEEVRDRCMQAEPVLDRQGNPTGEWKFESQSALKACELFGKHLKMFTDKVEHSGKVAFDTVPDDELDLRISKLLEQQKKD